MTNELALMEIGPDNTVSPASLAELHALLFPQPWSEATFAQMQEDTRTSGLIAFHRQASNNQLGPGEPMSPQGLVVQPVGFAFARIAADEAEILTIGVSALHQSSGIGAALLRELAKSVRTHGAHRLFLEVAKNNAPALKLYARAGFEKVGTRRGYYQSTNGTAMDAIIMARRLTGLADNELMHPKASMDAQR